MTNLLRIIHSKRGFSLVQILVAMAVFAVGFVPILNMMGRSGTATAKSRWMIIAANIARAEVDKLKRAEFDAIVKTSDPNHPSNACGYIGSWQPVTDDPLIPDLAGSPLRSSKPDAVNGFPPDYMKFEKRIDLTEIDYDSGSEVAAGGGKWRIGKAVIRVRWEEVQPNGTEIWRQMNFALLIPNTRLYIYQQ